MGSLALLQSLKENILGQASVKAIYGEPIAAPPVGVSLRRLSLQ